MIDPPAQNRPESQPPKYSILWEKNSSTLPKNNTNTNGAIITMIITSVSWLSLSLSLIIIIIIIDYHDYYHWLSL